MINTACLLGHVGQEPERKTTRSGTPWTRFSLATSERWTDKKTGERKERTEWHSITTFDERFMEIIEKYVHKGSKIYIEGKIRTRKWEDDKGQTRYATDIVLEGFGCRIELLDKREHPNEQMPDDGYGETPASSRQSAYAGSRAGTDPEIPF